ncbi:hypothetical protein ACJMK2_039997 [Sinanodonta woodiana]|uniref:Nucleoporin Nup159/Nup146 N-terminal domain-containing protein n=1 Tax=Sinanodonta woodiana TaxID=1069815 RepID=A0ABD3WEK9_SINWO
MADGGDEALDRDVKDFEFRQLCRVRIHSSPSSLPTRRSQLLAISSRFGLTFVAVDKELKVLQTSDFLRKDEEHATERIKYIVEDFPVLFSVVLEEEISMIALSCDSLTLAISTVNLASGIHFFDTRCFAVQGPKKPFTKCPLSCPVGSVLQDMAWNPVVPTLLVVCTSGGNVNLLEVTDRASIKASVPPLSGSTCVCWSPKGKQLVVGRQDGTLMQYDQNLNENRKWDLPNSLPESAYKVLDVHWLTNYQFLVAYIPPNAEPDIQPTVILIKGSKDAAPANDCFDDVCYGTGDKRQRKYFMIAIPNWDVLMLASSNAAEIGVIGKHLDDKRKWDHWYFEDSVRAECPVTDDCNDSYPKGLAVDFTSQREIPIGDNKVHPASPILIVLTTDGLLIPYHMIYSHPEAPKITVLPEPLQPAGVRKEQAGTSATSTPISLFGTGQTVFGSAAASASNSTTTGLPKPIFGTGQAFSLNMPTTTSGTTEQSFKQPFSTGYNFNTATSGGSGTTTNKMPLFGTTSTDSSPFSIASQSNQGFSFTAKMAPSGADSALTASTTNSAAATSIGTFNFISKFGTDQGFNFTGSVATTKSQMSAPTQGTGTSFGVTATATNTASVVSQPGLFSLISKQGSGQVSGFELTGSHATTKSTSPILMGSGGTTSQGSASAFSAKTTTSVIPSLQGSSLQQGVVGQSSQGVMGQSSQGIIGQSSQGVMGQSSQGVMGQSSQGVMGQSSQGVMGQSSQGVIGQSSQGVMGQSSQGVMGQSSQGVMGQSSQGVMGQSSQGVMGQSSQGVIGQSSQGVVGQSSQGVVGQSSQGVIGQSSQGVIGQSSQTLQPAATFGASAGTAAVVKFDTKPSGIEQQKSGTGSVMPGNTGSAGVPSVATGFKFAMPPPAATVQSTSKPAVIKSPTPVTLGQPIRTSTPVVSQGTANLVQPAMFNQSANNVISTLEAKPSPQTPPSNNEINDQVDSHFTNSILEEIQQFQQELKQHKIKSKQSPSNVGTVEERIHLKKQTEDMQGFCVEIKDTLQDQNKEMKDMKIQCLDMFAMMEECRVRKQRSSDPKYFQLLKSHALDPQSTDRLEKLQAQFQALDLGIQDVNLVLDMQWEEYQNQKKKSNRIQTPTRDAVYKALKSNRSILQAQKSRLMELEEQLKNLKIYKNPRSNVIIPQSPISLNKQNIGESELSSLADSLLYSDETSQSSVSHKSGLRPDKMAQLREHLSRRSVPIIKSTKPENLSMSRILSDERQLQTTRMNGQPSSGSRESRSPQRQQVNTPVISFKQEPNLMGRSFAPQNLFMKPNESSSPPVNSIYSQGSLKHPRVMPASNKAPTSFTGFINQVEPKQLPIRPQTQRTQFITGMREINGIQLENITPPSEEEEEEDDEEDEDSDDEEEDDEDDEEDQGFGPQYNMPTEVKKMADFGSSRPGFGAATFSSFVPEAGDGTKAKQTKPAPLPTTGLVEKVSKDKDASISTVSGSISSGTNFGFGSGQSFGSISGTPTMVFGDSATSLAKPGSSGRTLFAFGSASSIESGLGIDTTDNTSITKAVTGYSSSKLFGKSSQADANTVIASAQSSGQGGATAQGAQFSGQGGATTQGAQSSGQGGATTQGAQSSGPGVASTQGVQSLSQRGVTTQGAKTSVLGGASTQGAQSLAQGGAPTQGAQSLAQGGAPSQGVKLSAQGGVTAQEAQSSGQQGVISQGAQSSDQGGAPTQGVQSSSQKGATFQGAQSSGQGGALTQGAQSSSQKGATIQGAQPSAQGGAFTQGAQPSAQGGTLAQGVATTAPSSGPGVTRNLFGQLTTGGKGFGQPGPSAAVSTPGTTATSSATTAISSVTSSESMQFGGTVAPGNMASTSTVGFGTFSLSTSSPSSLFGKPVLAQASSQSSTNPPSASMSVEDTDQSTSNTAVCNKTILSLLTEDENSQALKQTGNGDSKQAATTTTTQGATVFGFKFGSNSGFGQPIFGQAATASQASSAKFGQTPISTSVMTTSSTTSTVFSQPDSVSSAGLTDSGTTTTPLTNPANGPNTATTQSVSGTTSSSVFGGNSGAETFTKTPFGSASTSGSGFGFGSASTPSSGVSFGTASTNSGSSGFGLFGQPKSALFGGTAATTASNNSPFSQTSTNVGTGLFGQASSSGSPFGSSTATSSTGLLFGQSSTSSSSPFGGPSMGGNAGSGLFGQQGTSSSLFGSASSAPSSGGFSFGQQQSGTSSGSSFSFSSASVPSSSGGGGGMFGGGGLFSGLGGKPSEEKAKQNVFGSPQTFSGPSSQASVLFGNQSAKTSGSFGSPQTSSSFSGVAFSNQSGGGVGSTGFGLSQQHQTAGGFGSPPRFGGVPTFGSGSAFGTAPAFGSSPVFGSQTAGAFGGQSVFGSSSGVSQNSATGGFASFASSGSPTFGSLAQASDLPTFGGIGQSGGSQFSNAPTFGSPAFGSPGFGQSSTGFGSQGGSGFGGSSFGSGPSFTGYRS